ncbi:GIN domain-containing protein [Rikenella microfusus]|uniref:Protein of uncharacterized function (DUF2807) n=1 Tax=Rikenella microfusus TaxID=28139 RepID=A0A379MQZ8_9BACT|nr:DUF2807 domain-containing protein [Rikenella microfusus]SUE33965.1 Protein of uncharacterised function (DUF2807) [Rikenella microfusus]
MKHLLFAALMFVCINVTACFPQSDKVNRAKAEQTAETATTVVEDKFQGQRIDAVDVGFAFQAVIRKSDRTGVRISIDSRLEPYLVCKLENGRLTLGMKNDLPQYLRYGQYWTIQPAAVIDVRELNAIEASGAAKITAEGEFRADDIKIQTSGASKTEGLHIETGGSVSVDCSGASQLTGANFGHPSRVGIAASGATRLSFACHTRALGIDAGGTAKIELSGSVGHLTADVSGVAKCQLGEMVSETAECSVSGAARIDCHATGRLSASASGASHISCTGNPEVLKKAASGASSISIR